MQEERNSLKFHSRYMSGEASGKWGILALLAIVVIFCATAAACWYL